MDSAAIGGSIHFAAIKLEKIIKREFDLVLKGGDTSKKILTMGGLATADHFENDPLAAAYIVIGKLYNSSPEADAKIDQFWGDWGYAFVDKNKDEEYLELLKDYAKALDELITNLKGLD